MITKQDELAINKCIYNKAADIMAYEGTRFDDDTGHWYTISMSTAVTEAADEIHGWDDEMFEDFLKKSLTQEDITDIKRYVFENYT